jgi:hypothetical protein
MARVYTRGVEMDLARTEQRPSLARQWGAPAAPGPLATLAPSTPPAPVQLSPAGDVSLEALAAPLVGNVGFRDALLSLARSDPSLRQALIEAVFGGGSADAVR